MYIESGDALSVVAEGDSSHLAPLLDLRELTDVVGEFARLARAPNTRRAYQSDWRAFESWCAAHSIPPFPAAPPTIAMYLGFLATQGKKASTINRAMAAIAARHRSVLDASGNPTLSPTRHPIVVETMAGIRRAIGSAPSQKRALTIDDALLPMVQSVPDTVRGVRDRAILLLGFAGAMRRSELASLRIEDVRFEREGLVAWIRQSKTDHDARGAEVAIGYGSRAITCPVRAVEDWIQLLSDRGITEGALFRYVNAKGRILAPAKYDPGRLVNIVVKRAAVATGLDPKAFGAHSLRSGLATEAALRGKPIDAIAKAGRWKTIDVAVGYIRRARKFQDAITVGLGL